MKAPSPLCLHALRRLTYSTSPSTYCRTTQRHYASQLKQSPPPSASTSPPPLPRQPPTPGFRLRQKSDDSEDHTPVPLTRPIGLPYAPQPGQNTGLDHRTLKTRRDEFVDYDKHLIKRAKMTKQIAKPYFRDWSNLRFHKGKVFVAPERLFKAETALWFPNFFGRTLRKGAERRDKKDGYRGMGRDTCDVMRGKVSLVNFVTNNWAANQTATWRSGNLAEALRGNLDIAQVVEINYENNLLKYWIWRLFALPRLRRSMPQPGLQERYFLVRRGFNEEMKEAMGVLNEKAGYLYLVDRDCRIRWAGSAVAEEHEKESLVRGLKKLLLEARGARTTKKQRLESAVNDVVDDGKEKVAAAG